MSLKAFLQLTRAGMHNSKLMEGQNIFGENLQGPNTDILSFHLAGVSIEQTNWTAEDFGICGPN